MTRKSKYSPEFKEQAVKRTLTGSFTIKEVSESLGYPDRDITNT